MTIKVSIILTSYNHDRFIEESINSVLQQSFEDYELIIIDDCSSDRSWEIINSFTDYRIITVRNPKNFGRGNISRTIHEKAHGEYIAIHHSDDIWEASKLEKQILILDRDKEIGAVFSHAKLIDDTGKIINKVDHPYNDIFNQPNRTRYEWLRFFFYFGNALCHPSVVIRKECFNYIDYRAGLAQLPDLDLWIQLCLKYEIFIIQEELVKFRIHNDNSNTSSNCQDAKIRLNYEYYKVLDNYKKITTNDELFKIFPEAKKYRNCEYIDPLFTLGMVALDEGRNKPTKLFGLDRIFDAINDSQRSEKLEKYLGFSEKTFFSLTKRYDIFNQKRFRDYLFSWIRRLRKI